MAETKYSYVISTGTANGVVEPAALSQEIHSSSIVHAVSRIDTSGDAVDIWMKAALAAGDQTTLTVVVNSHQGISLTPAPQVVHIEEESPGTQGHFTVESFELVCDHAIGTWKEMDISWPYNVSIFSTQFVQMPNMEGDLLQVLVAPDMIIGAITADVAATDTVINVQQSVLDNTCLGHGFKLFDGVNQDDLGRVVGKDDIAKTVTVETAATNAFASASPTYCQNTAKFTPQIYLRDRYKIELGKDAIGGSLIPANVPLKVRYKNVEGTTKTFSVIVEYKY